jgi:hypothetical protein
MGHAYNIEVVYPDEKFARKHESTIGHIIQQPLISQGKLRDGYRMEYGPIDRDDYRRLEGRIYSKLGNAVSVRLVQVMYATEHRERASNLEIRIPEMSMWEQIGGDMDPGTYGGTIATGDGSSLELLKIQPVREYVGDKEAAEVGFPFWTREAYFDVDDLDPSHKDVKSALDSIGMELDTLENDFTPTQRALVIAEALLDYGRADEGPAGWSKDIISEKVKWSTGKIEGPEYLADEDDAFLREILLGDLDVDYESYGPDENEPTSGLKVVVRGHTVEITEWTDVEDATGEEQPEGEKISRQYAEVELDNLFDPKGKHRGSYSGDNREVSLVELAQMDDDAREKAIVAAAIAYLAYYGGEEEFVDRIGD